MKSDFLGAVIVIAASLASNLGVNVQKRSHVKEEKRPTDLRRPYTKRPMWWGGMILVVFGSLGDFFALGFASQTLVASLGGGSVILFNIVFAKFWLKQDLYLTDVLGVVIVSIGVVVCALSSSKEEEYTIGQLFSFLEAPGFILYAILTSIFVMSLILRVRRSKAPALRAVPLEQSTLHKEKQEESNPRTTIDPINKKQSKKTEAEASPFPSPVYDTISLTPNSAVDSSSDTEVVSKQLLKDAHTPEKHILIIDKNLPLYWAAISGTIGAQSVLLAKCVMEMIFQSIHGENQFKYIGTYILIAGMVGTLLTQTHALNMATMCGDTMSTFPVFQAFWIGFSNISGVVFFQQSHNFTSTQWTFFPIAMLLVMFGIYLIAKHEKMGNHVKYSVAMPLQLSSPRQHHIVAQSFVFKELTPQRLYQLEHQTTVQPEDEDPIENGMIIKRHHSIDDRFTIE